MANLLNADKPNSESGTINTQPTISVLFNFTVSAHVPSFLSNGSGRCAGGGSQFWDPLKQMCYNVTCGFLYTNIGGQCVYRNISGSLLKEANQISGDRPIRPIQRQPLRLNGVPLVPVD